MAGCDCKFELTAFAKFKPSAFPVGCIESLGEEGSVDTIREALKKRPLRMFSPGSWAIELPQPCSMWPCGRCAATCAATGKGGRTGSGTGAGAPLAELYRAQGQYAQAEPLYKRALAIYEKALGPEHPAVSTSLENLAELYRATQRDKEAEKLERRAASIRSIKR